MKKIIISYSLFFVTSVLLSTSASVNVNSVNVKRVHQEIAKVIEQQKEANYKCNIAEEDLLKTEKGKIYEAATSAWYDCNDTHVYSVCQNLHFKTLQRLLSSLKETPEYTEYMPLLEDSLYYSHKHEGLSQMKEYAVWYNNGSDEYAMLAAINSLEKPYVYPPELSTTFLHRSSDLDKIHSKVKQDLREFIKQNIKD